MKNKVKVNPVNRLKEVRFTRNYPGYIYRREMVESMCDDTGDMEMVNCYSADTGNYLGDAKVARFLCNMKGLRQIQKTDPKHCVCSIGFNEKEQKWYGWSHRAIFGFGVGSRVKKGDVAYCSNSKDDFLKEMVTFWDDESHENVVGRHEINDGVSGVSIKWGYNNKTENKKIRETINSVFMPYPDKFGKGEWEAKSIEDAKQMAVDFARDVS